MRVLSDWLTAYMEFTERSEPPLLYREWVGTSTIAAAMQRKLYLPQALKEPIYPNIYVVLVGEPGKCRKGTAMGVGRRLLDEVGIRVAPTSVTIEALYIELEEIGTDLTDDDGERIFHSSLSVMSEEFMVFLDYNNPNFLSSLTHMWDCDRKFEYKTKNMRNNEIPGVWLNLLGATTPYLIQNALPPGSIGGGLASRMIFVYEDDIEGRVNAQTEYTPEQIRLREALLKDLSEINLMSGKFKEDPDAAKWYEDWYLSYDTHKPDMPAAFTGYIARRPTHLRKAAMIMSASRSGDKVITVSDYERALDLHERTEVRMPRTFMGIGASRMSNVIERLRMYIASNGVSKVKDIHMDFAHDFDGMRHFADTLASLCDSGFCEYVHGPKGLEIHYIPTNKSHKWYEKLI